MFMDNGKLTCFHIPVIIIWNYYEKNWLILNTVKMGEIDSQITAIVLKKILW